MISKCNVISGSKTVVCRPYSMSNEIFTTFVQKFNYK